VRVVKVFTAIRSSRMSKGDSNSSHLIPNWEPLNYTERRTRRGEKSFPGKLAFHQTALFGSRKFRYSCEQTVTQVSVIYRPLIFGAEQSFFGSVELNLWMLPQ
jgi:hypothetical protein